MTRKRNPKKKRTKHQRSVRQQERLLRDRDALKVLRQHFDGYGTGDGFSLSLDKLAALPAARRRALRRKYKKVAPMLAGPHALVKPKNRKQRKALQTFQHKRFRGAKHVIVQVPTASSRVRFVKDRPQVTSQFPGEAEHAERLFLFPRRARGPEDMLKMLERLKADMPDEGRYVMLTDTYGDTGTLADKGSVSKLLRQYLGEYDKAKYGEGRFLNRVIGFRWVRSKLEGQAIRQAKNERRAAAREENERRRREYERDARARARRKR
jgi:hypothetical protein